MPIHDWPWPFAIRIFNSGGDRPPLPTKFCGREDRKILRLLPLIYAILPRRCRRGSHQAINRFIIAHLFWLCKYFLRYFQYFLCVLFVHKLLELGTNLRKEFYGRRLIRALSYALFHHQRIEPAAKLISVFRKAPHRAAAHFSYVYS